MKKDQEVGPDDRSYLGRRDALVTEAGEESFPASDPPSTWAGQDPRDAGPASQDPREAMPARTARARLVRRVRRIWDAG